jgi:hypothetical protein
LFQRYLLLRHNQAGGTVMKALTMDGAAGYGFGASGHRERLAARGRLARRSLHRAATVMTVFALVGALHAMRWAGMLVL